MTNRDIFPPHLAVSAMRDSGYKNAAYAIAELMDNSIQAGASTVELLCGERDRVVNYRTRAQISEIAVLDNGCGMDAAVLQMALQFGNGTRLNDYSGIGRFGMGLPSSSISQSRRVEVWTWQDGHENAIYSYIDIDEIKSGYLKQVPVPASRPLPSTWLEVGETFGRSGTLVVWKTLDRIIWRTARAIISNSEFLIGRMYRYFLSRHVVRIRLASFDMDAYPRWRKTSDEDARANDPLYLIPDTSCPAPWDRIPMFAQHSFQNTEFKIKYLDEIHTVIVRFAYAKEEARKTDGSREAGSLPFGKHANKNKGVSIVRANRELDLDSSWADETSTRDRWWGVEVSFPPALDELFGVTNNKQSARNFSQLAKTDLESELAPGQTLGSRKEELNADEDPRLPLFEIAQHIRTNISTIRRLLRAQTASSRPKRHPDSEAEVKATKRTRERIEQQQRGESDDQEEQQSNEERQAEIENQLVEHGLAPSQAQELAAQTVGRGLKYTITTSSVASPAFFDVKPRGGSIIISLNVDHPAYTHLVEVLRQELEDLNESDLRECLSNARRGLELLLMAWARYEDEQPAGRQRDNAQDARWDWGRVARDFLYEED